MKKLHPVRTALLLAGVSATSVFVGGGTAHAAITPVGLGTATDFAIRAGDAVTNVPTSSVTGDVGLSPGPGAAYAGLTCAEVTGAIYSVDASGPAPCVLEDPGHMTTVENDARTAFNSASALPGATPLDPDLAGLSLVSGLYGFGAAATNLSGTLTLDAQGDPDAAWVFQASSSLITSDASTVAFSNLPAGVTAAQMACNVLWTVGSSATLNTTTTFVGTILASASISVLNDVTVIGRLLAANAAGAGGAVTLISDTITAPTGCAALPPGSGGNPVTPPAGTPPAGTPTAPPAGTPPGAPPEGSGPPEGSAPPATPVGAPPAFTG